SKTPGRDSAGKVTMAQCREIAEQKFVDLNANDLDQATKIIAGSARSMGLQVVE
ncbi:MAG: 50S ribosomal protein L11, partial [Parvibaculum sp.]|nr:50S ribosomal protein L11 [Parvibaculum sp.]